MTGRNTSKADSPQETRETSKQASARLDSQAEAARDDRESDRGVVVGMEDIARAPNASDLVEEDRRGDAAFQSEGQRRDVATGNELGGSDVPIGGEQYVSEGGKQDSTNAVTKQARMLLVDNPNTYTLTGPFPPQNEADISSFIHEISGSTNSKAGKTYTAIKSTKFSFPGGKGMRAAILHKDGTCTFLSNGTTYSQWYSSLKRQGGVGLIWRFNQGLEAENPYVQCDIYMLKALPQPGNADEEIDW